MTTSNKSIPQADEHQGTAEIIEADLKNTSHLDDAVMLVDLYAKGVNDNGQGLPEQVRTALPMHLASQPTARIFIAYLNGQPAGVAVCFGSFSTFRAAPILNIHDLAVHPDFRGKGVGTALINHVEIAARASGCAYVTLEVDDQNPRARQLYKRTGFEDSGPDETVQYFMKKPL
jgi:ribosomal protein S18 acetylase RimI-like enzyme